MSDSVSQMTIFRDNESILIREKMLEFFSTVLPAPFPYLSRLQILYTQLRQSNQIYNKSAARLLAHAVSVKMKDSNLKSAITSPTSKEAVQKL